MTERRHLRRLVVAGQINGASDALEALLGEVAESEADAAVIVGDLTVPWSRPESFRAIFRALGEARRPAFWVPGPADAPVSDYLRESYNMEFVYPHLHGVHGTFAIGPSHVLFAGMGGEIRDDPDAIRVEEAGLRYPAWEVEYRLKAIRELKEYQKVFLFTTQPAHKGLHGEGSEVLAELINTYRPRVAVVAGDGVAEARLGKTLVVCPGRLEHGQYALIDLHDLEVEARTLAEHAPI
jgi:Icc-related predicted phosphoesterase